jgi:hypothetical protein
MMSKQQRIAVVGAGLGGAAAASAAKSGLYRRPVRTESGVFTIGCRYPYGAKRIEDFSAVSALNNPWSKWRLTRTSGSAATPKRVIIYLASNWGHLPAKSTVPLT